MMKFNINLQLFARTASADISRMITVKQKEVFLKNFDPFPIEYPEFTTEKKATKKTETFDSMGNLSAAEVKPEGGSISYGKVEQAYQTEITVQTYAKGFQHTMEAIKFDLNGVMEAAKAKELARVARECEEARAIYWVDNAVAVNLADGVPLGSDSRPLFNSGGTNDTLTTGALAPTTINTAVGMFSQFKNHQGGPMKCRVTDGLTNAINMLTVEEIMKSALRAYELSNTSNQLPKIAWHYSSYMSSTTAWMLWDKSFEHILMLWFEKTQFGQDEDKRDTLDLYYNYYAIYESGCLPNVGLVYSAGT